MDSLTNGSLDQPNEYPVDEEAIQRVSELVGLLANEGAHTVDVELSSNQGTPEVDLSLRLES